MKTALIAGIVSAVVAAASGTATTIVITSKDIKDGTIQTVDISAKAKRALKGNRGAPGVTGAAGQAGAQGSQGPAGPQGLAGVQGPPGQQGDQGDQGEQGPHGEQGPSGVSKAYFRDHTFPQILEVPDSPAPIARIYLPAGKFVILASAAFSNPGAQEALVQCQIANANGGESAEFRTTLRAASPELLYDSASIAIQKIVTPAVAEYHYLQCTDSGGGVHVASLVFPELSAIEVDEILPGVGP